MRIARAFAAALLPAVLGLCLFAAQARASGEHALLPFSVTKPAKSERAPVFALTDLEGKKRPLDEFRGSVVLLHFWASWCAPCRHEFPALKKLSEEFGPRGLVVVAIAGDSRERAGAFIKETGASFPVLIDQYGSAMRAYRIGAIPATVIVGRDGLVLGTLLGPREYDSKQAKEYFDAILK